MLVRACARVHARVCMRARLFVPVRTPVRVRVRVCVCVCARARARVHALLELAAQACLLI